MNPNGSDEEKALAVIEQHSPEMANAQARVISKFAEGSLTQFTDRELEIMRRPATVQDLQIKPCKAHRESNGEALCPRCQIHEPWVHCQKRLDEAFGSEWAITPAPWNPKFMRDGNIVYREMVLWIRGQYIESAPGSHEEFRQTGNIGDAMEACRGSALVRVCKHKFSTNLDLWDLREREKNRRALATFRKSGKPPVPPETIEVAKHATGAESVSPSLSSSIPPDSAPIFQFAVAEEYKEAIRNVQTLEALKVVWENIYKHRESIPPATFEILKDLKDSRKKVLQ